jgi:hypothetical protein
LGRKGSPEEEEEEEEEEEDSAVLWRSCALFLCDRVRERIVVCRRSVEGIYLLEGELQICLLTCQVFL